MRPIDSWSSFFVLIPGPWKPPILQSMEWQTARNTSAVNLICHHQWQEENHSRMVLKVDLGSRGLQMLLLFYSVSSTKGLWCYCGSPVMWTSRSHNRHLLAFGALLLKMELKYRICFQIITQHLFQRHLKEPREGRFVLCVWEILSFFLSPLLPAIPGSPYRKCL